MAELVVTFAHFSPKLFADSERPTEELDFE